MKTAVLVSRILLGAMFLIFGLNGFLHFIPTPPMTGLIAEFNHAFFASGYAYMVFAVQTIAGFLLLANKFVPLALVLLGPVIVNILAFHLAFQPAGLPPGLVAAILWIVIAYRYRTLFVPFLKNNSGD